MSYALGTNISCSGPYDIISSLHREYGNNDMEKTELTSTDILQIFNMNASFY